MRKNITLSTKITLSLFKNYENKEFSKVEALLDLYLQASQAKKTQTFNNCKFILRSNSFVTSYNNISKRWMWHISRTQRFLLFLEKNKIIERKETNKGSIISII